MDDTSAMFVSLKSGNCDLVVTDKPTALAAVSVNSDLKMLDFTGKDDNFKVSDGDISIGISIKKGNKELVDAINSVLSTMTKDDYEKMMSDVSQYQPLAQ